MIARTTFSEATAGVVGVPGREVAPGDRLALPGAQVGGHGLGPVRAAARLEGRAHPLAQGGLRVGPRRPRRLVEVGALGYRERLGRVPEPDERAPLPRQLPGPPLLLAGQRGRAWCLWDARRRQRLGEPGLCHPRALRRILRQVGAPVAPLRLLGPLRHAGPLPPAAGARRVPRAALAVRAVHARRPVGHLGRGEPARLLHPQPTVQVVAGREQRQPAARLRDAHAAAVDLPEDPLALLPGARRTPPWTRHGPRFCPGSQ